MTPREISCATLLFLAAACRPADVQRPGVPDGEPASVAAPPPQQVERPGHRTLVGLYCPASRGDRVIPLWIRGRRWSASGEAEAAVARGRVRQFSVLGWDGRRAGVFVVAGTAAGERPIAVGSYAGGRPCSIPGEGGPGEDDPLCTRAMGECGIAVGTVEPIGGPKARPFEENPDPRPVAVGGVCADGTRVAADIDADGRPETFSSAAFVRTEASMSDEALSCRPSFAAPSVASELEQPLDIVAVADFDNDGRRELVVRHGDSMSLYVSTDSAARLLRIGPVPIARPD